MLCALIMAGGKGERFWPLSTDEKPKQFLNLIGNDTMIQMTVKRINKIIPLERIFVVTAKKYVKLVKSQLPKLPERNIIVEPIGRNTAPCITLSALLINKYYQDSTMIVLPADHIINDEEKFIVSIQKAEMFIKNNENSVATFGMKPTRAETGYGYIKLKNKDIIINHMYKVEKFVEKPNKDIAEKYLRDGNYLWNGGMFIWKCATILNLIKKYLNNTYEILSNVISKESKDYEKEIRGSYFKVDNLSIDYGIMEKINNLYVLPCDFGWDDVGTWYSVERYREKDKNNNVCIGDIRSMQCHNSILFGKEKPIIIVGLDDVFVIESDDIIFVGKKDNIENIKEIKSRFSKEVRENSEGSIGS